MKSIRTRLLVAFALVMVLILAAFGVMVFLLVTRNLDRDIDRLVRDKAAVLARSIYTPDFTIAPWLELEMETERLGFFLQVFDAEGNFRSKSANLPTPVPISASTREAATRRFGPVVETVLNERGEPIRLATWPRGEKRGDKEIIYLFAQAGIPLKERGARLGRLLLWLAAGGAVAVTVSLLTMRFLINQWLRSMAALTETARKTSAQNLSRQRLFVPPDDDELARLARTFNEMLDRLETAYTTQQRFVADASHELRTPLTILRGEIEVALRRPRSAGEYCEVLQSGKEEIERMSRLVENLLALAHADAGEAVAAREPVDVSSICREVCKKLAPLAEENKVALKVEAEIPVKVSGDRYALERIIFNLVENAIRYTPRGENVTARVTQSDGQAILEVADTGPGIPAEHLPHIFERFYRVDQARSREFGGAGLGLAIVKVFVEAHGGRIDVTSEVGKGTVFAVRLPK